MVDGSTGGAEPVCPALALGAGKERFSGCAACVVPDEEEGPQRYSDALVLEGQLSPGQRHGGHGHPAACAGDQVEPPRAGAEVAAREGPQRDPVPVPARLGAEADRDARGDGPEAADCCE